MLAIGDIVLNNIDSFYKIKNYEYIYKGEEQFNLLLNTFNLKEEEKIDNNLISTTYKKNNIYYSFHNADNYIVLNSILQLTLSDNLKFKLCPIIIEWAICKTRIKFINKDIKQWIKRIELYSYVNNILSKFDNEIVHSVMKYSLNLSSWILKNNDIDNKMHREKEFSLYTKKQLHDLVSNNKPVYYNMLLDDKEDFIMDSYFNKLSDNDKLNAGLQKLYVTTINEYILPILEKDKILPVDIYTLFMSAYMDNCSNMVNYKFSQFLIDNYYEILANYNENIISKKFMRVYETRKKEILC